jgi:NCAIR mutase (PurE)-related protein
MCWVYFVNPSTRFAIALQRLHEHEVAIVVVQAGGSGSLPEKLDSVISQLKV